MASFPSRGVVVVLLFLTPVYSADLDQELRATLAVNQLALQEQSFALAQHSQALSQLLQRQEGNQLDSHGVSQALVQMAQGFQTTISQLSQELSSLIQLNKELATQQSSSITELTEMAENIRLSQSHLEERMASSQRNMTETLNLLIQKSETTNEAESCPTLSPVVTLPPVSLPPETLPPVTLPPETLPPVTLPPETSPPTPSGPPGAERVSDGVFLIVQEKKSWMEANDNCQEMGGYLASPPSDMEAFETFLINNGADQKNAWLGGREEEGSPDGYRYLDGTPVNSQHWYSGDAKTRNGCVHIYAGWGPLWAYHCSSTFASVCRFD